MRFSVYKRFVFSASILAALTLPGLAQPDGGQADESLQEDVQNAVTAEQLPADVRDLQKKAEAGDAEAQFQLG